MDRLVPCICGAILWLTSAVSLTPLSAQTRSDVRLADSKEITVTGEGATLWLARNDAVRQALASFVSQFVVSDLRISGDSIVKDDLISTLNGFVKDFQQLDVQNINGAWVIRAQVTVGASEVLNFVSRPTSNKSIDVNGIAILAAVKGRQESVQANGRLIRHLLEDYSATAINSVVDSIRVNAQQGAVSVFFSAFNDSSFIAQLLAVGKAVSPKEFVPFENKRFPQVPYQQLGILSSDMKIPVVSICPTIACRRLSLDAGSGTTPVKPDRYPPRRADVKQAPIQPASSVDPWRLITGFIAFDQPTEEIEALDALKSLSGELNWVVRTEEKSALFSDYRTYCSDQLFNRGAPFLPFPLVLATDKVSCRIDLPATFFEGATNIQVEVGAKTPFADKHIGVLHIGSDRWFHDPMTFVGAPTEPNSAWMRSAPEGEFWYTDGPLTEAFVMTSKRRGGRFLRAWTTFEGVADTPKVVDSLVVVFLDMLDNHGFRRTESRGSWSHLVNGEVRPWNPSSDFLNDWAVKDYGRTELRLLGRGLELASRSCNVRASTGNRSFSLGDLSAKVASEARRRGKSNSDPLMTLVGYAVSPEVYSAVTGALGADVTIGELISRCAQSNTDGPRRLFLQRFEANGRPSLMIGITWSFECAVARQSDQDTDRFDEACR